MAKSEHFILGFPAGERESKAAKVIKALTDEEMEAMRVVGRVRNLTMITMIPYVLGFQFHCFGGPQLFHWVRAFTEFQP